MTPLDLLFYSLQICGVIFVCALAISLMIFALAAFWFGLLAVAFRLSLKLASTSQVVR